MLQQRLVDLARRDVFAAFDDQLLQAAGNEVEPVGVTMAQIAGREPTARIDRFRGPLGRLEIFEHDVRSAHLDLAALAIVKNGPVACDDARLDAERKADAADFPPRRVQRIRERDRRAFGQSQRFQNRKTEARFEIMMLMWRQRRGRRACKPNVSTCFALCGRQLGAVQQIRDDRRHDVQPRRSIVLDPVPPLRHAETMRHHDAAARDERRDRCNALSVDVVERQRREHAIVAGQPLRRRNRFTRVDHVRMREQHALRYARCPRRVHQHGR